MTKVRTAKYRVGQVVRHRFFPFRGVVFGSAPTEVALVSLSVGSVCGEVEDGLWVIGTRLPLRPEQLQWRFEAEDGTIIRSGSGELN